MITCECDELPDGARCAPCTKNAETWVESRDKYLCEMLDELRAELEEWRGGKLAPQALACVLRHAGYTRDAAAAMWRREFQGAEFFADELLAVFQRDATPAPKTGGEATCSSCSQEFTECPLWRGDKAFCFKCAAALFAGPPKPAPPWEPKVGDWVRHKPAPTSRAELRRAARECVLLGCQPEATMRDVTQPTRRLPDHVTDEALAGVADRICPKCNGSGLVAGAIGGSWVCECRK